MRGIVSASGTPGRIIRWVLVERASSDRHLAISLRQSLHRSFSRSLEKSDARLLALRRVFAYRSPLVCPRERIDPETESKDGRQPGGA
jgi:hypothetical protein